MDLIEKINAQHEILLESSPSNYDVSLTSIDSFGNPGQLNIYVLGQLGYSIDDLPNEEQLTHGFSPLTSDGKKTILFVVTLSSGSTSENLKKNLYNTLTEFRGWFRDKTLWVPLMGTGDGGLQLEESYNITVQAINKLLDNYPTSTTFIISLPNNEKGQLLLNKINSTNLSLSEKINATFNNYSGNYYLVGADWEGEKLEETFYTEKIWKTGYDEKYARIINSVKRGDLLFIKSTFTQDKISMLRIKALGMVIDNPEDGQTLNIDWRIKNIKIDIKNLGHYRNTITQVNNQNLKIILDIVGREKIYLAGLLNVSIWGKSTQNIKLDNDSASASEDLLDVSNEINVFARLLAKRDLSPPLAIALFGDWGSGKSFFINHLQQKIKQLSESKIVQKNNDNELYYCKNIIHIPFNAWAYLDANLWVGFMACIFEKIDEYISGISKGQIAKNGIKSKLSNELQIVKDQKANTIAKKETLEKRKEELEKNIQSEKVKLDQAIKDLTEESWISRINTIWDELKIRDIYTKELETLGITPELLEKTANTEIPNKIKSFKNYFFQFKSLTGKQLIWTIILIVALIFSSLFISNSLRFQNFVAQITSISATLVFTIIAILKKIEIAFKYFKPYVDKALAIQIEFNQKIKEAERVHQDKITKIQIEKETTSIEIEKLQTEISKIDNVIDEIDYSLSHALEKIVIADFIKNRALSKDYSEKLGVVSIIRKDLETLSELFIEQKIDQYIPENERKQLEERKNRLKEIKAEFKNESIERIILYIDDLDRCSDEKVLEVLQAVHLLMAFPLFIVVVGVDKRCVSNALFQSEQSKYFKLHAESQIINHKIQPVEPNEYLEKIFQIPFQLKDATKDSVDKMIEKLLEKDLAKQKVVTKDETKNISSARESITSDIPSTNEHIAQESITKKDIGPDDLEITDQELVYIKDFSHLIGSSPRTIKRYINLYRLIKAHEELDNTKNEKEIICTMFILAINIGKHKAHSFEFFYFIKSQSKMLLNEIFNLYSTSEKHDLYLDLITSTTTMQKLKQYKGDDVLQHLPFVKRFSFNTSKEKY